MNTFFNVINLTCSVYKISQMGHKINPLSGEGKNLTHDFVAKDFVQFFIIGANDTIQTCCVFGSSLMARKQLIMYQVN